MEKWRKEEEEEVRDKRKGKVERECVSCLDCVCSI